MTSHLSPGQKSQLREALSASRSRLQAQRLSQLDGHSRAEHAREVLLQDGDDAPQRDADREVDLALADRDVVALAEVDAALQRLDDTGRPGAYGLCSGCGEPIPFARLQLQPAALRCVACEGLRERGAPRSPSL